MLRIGLVGCGAIGTELVKAIVAGKAGNTAIVAVFDVVKPNAEAVGRLASCEVADSLEGLLAKKPDLVVEAAAQQVVRNIGEKVLVSGSSLMVMSAGALLDDELLTRLMAAAEKGGGSIYVPTGAVLAIDALKAAQVAGIESVELITRKSPKSLGIEAEKETVLFEGPAEEAVKKFPLNINVAATISLAGIGKKKTKVKIIADPKAVRNSHELRVVAKCGSFVAKIENLPSPSNPKTSYIAALSAIRLLKNLGEKLKVGT